MIARAMAEADATLLAKAEIGTFRSETPRGLPELLARLGAMLTGASR